MMRLAGVMGTVLSLTFTVPYAAAQAPEVEGAAIDQPVVVRAPSGVKPFSVELVEADTAESTSTVTVRFDRKVSWAEAPKIEDHGTFIQVGLIGTLVSASGQFYEGAGPYLSKVAAFQSSPEDGALRLFLTKDAAIVAKGLSAEVIGDKLVITIDHKKLEGYGLTTHVTKEKIPGTPPVEDVVANTKVRDDIVDPAAQLNEMPEAEAATFGVAKRDLSGKMIGVAVFSGVMIVALGMFHLARRLVARGRGATGRGGAESTTSLKMVASYNLAPKQRVTLMEVGGEQILLGVSPGGIQYLTTVGPKVRPIPPQNGTVNYGPAIGLPPSGPAVTVARREPRVQGAIAGAPRPTPTVPVKAKVDGGGRLNVRIDDDGVHQRPAQSAAAPHGAQAIEDVTRMIRSKLKNLP